MTTEPASLSRRSHRLQGRSHRPQLRPDTVKLINLKIGTGLPWFSSKESTCQCRRHGFNLWSGKMPHAAEQLRCNGAHNLQLLKPASPRACAPQQERPHNKKPMSCNYRKACSATKIQHGPRWINKKKFLRCICFKIKSSKRNVSKINFKLL